jgi:hypothetical protein
MNRCIVNLALIGLALVSSAARAAGSARAEIDALLEDLSKSACTFYRNGRWHPAPKAASHLRRKLDYLERKGRLDSADAFIADAGTRSSVSGEAYQVRCADLPVEESALWLKRTLEQRRMQTPNRDPPR